MQFLNGCRISDLFFPDINECETNMGDCSQACYNTNGSHACLCVTGYVLNADGRTCNGNAE